VANYGGGSVACLPIQDDGSLKAPSATIQHAGSGPDPNRQKNPHAHSINVDPANKYAFAADLGLDKVLIYKFDSAAGTLTENGAGTVPPGSGPRHFAFHPAGKYAYVINEMTSTVTAYAYDAEKGALKELQTLSTLVEPVKGNSTAEVVVHPSGKFLYGSNRGHDSIAVFTIDQESGRLTAAGHTPTGGKTPRGFSVDPTGSYLLAGNQNSGTISVFKIDQQTGALTAVGEPIAAPSPVCIRFLKK
jgi:6-phosphogluconolactonase